MQRCYCYANAATCPFLQDAHEFLQHMMTVLFDDNMAELVRLEGLVEASSYARNTNYQSFFAANTKPSGDRKGTAATTPAAGSEESKDATTSTIWRDLTTSTVCCVRKPLLLHPQRKTKVAFGELNSVGVACFHGLCSRGVTGAVCASGAGGHSIPAVSILVSSGAH